MSKVITIASLLNLYREAGLPIVVTFKEYRSSVTGGAPLGVFIGGRKVQLYRNTGDDQLRLTLMHEFVHHLQYRPSGYHGHKMCTVISEERDKTPTLDNWTPQYMKYWATPVEQEARYYESHSEEFDILVQKHGHSALQWEEVVMPKPVSIPPSKLTWIVTAAFAAFALLLVGAAASYTVGAKISALEVDNRYLHQRNAEILEQLDKHDPCAIVASVEEEESCRP
jgi:hypothetical protein